jgi:hypothetical protein
MWRDAVLVAVAGGSLAFAGAVRNYAIDGSLLPTRSGENLFVGNCAYSSQMIPRYDLDLLPAYGAAVALRRLGLPPGSTPPSRAFDAALTHEAIAFVLANPMDTVRLKLENFFYFYDVRLIPFEPNGPDTTVTLLPDGHVRVDQPRIRSTAASLTHSVAYGFILTAALIGLWRRRRCYRTDELVLCSVGVFTLVSVVYFPTTRMRVPIDPILMAYAGCVIGPLWAWLGGGERRHREATLAAHAAQT